MDKDRKPGGKRQSKGKKVDVIKSEDSADIVRIETPSALSLIQARLAEFTKPYTDNIPFVPDGVKTAMNAIIGLADELDAIDDVRVALLGRSGVGKTTLLNMILLMTEASPFNYQPDEKVLEEIKKSGRIVAFEDLLAQMDGNPDEDSFVIEPARSFPDAHDPDDDKKMREALQAFKSMESMRSYAESNNLNDKNLTPRRFLQEFAKSFLLTQAEVVDTPTTQCVFEIRNGDTYRLEVVYNKREDVEATLAPNKSDVETSEEESDSEESEMNRSAETLRSYVLLDSPTESTSRSAKRARQTKDEHDAGLPFKPEVERVLGKTLVFLTEGLDIVQDRAYCANIIRTLGRHGLEGVCAWGEDPQAHSEASKPPREEKALPADGWVVKHVRVFVPSILLQQGLCLLDIPGVDDTNVLRWDATKSALETCDAVIALTDKDSLEASKSIEDSLKSFVMPRMFGKGDKPALALFKCDERGNYIGEGDFTEPRALPDSTVAHLLKSLPKAHGHINKEERTRVEAELKKKINYHWTALRPVLSASLVLDQNPISDLESRRRALQSTGMSLLFDFLLEAVVRSVRDPLQKTVHVASRSLKPFKDDNNLLLSKLKEISQAIHGKDAVIGRLYKEKLDRFTQFDSNKRVKADAEKAVEGDLTTVEKYLDSLLKHTLKADMEKRQPRTILAVFAAEPHRLKDNCHRTFQALDWFTNPESARFSAAMKPQDILEDILDLAADHVSKNFEALPLGLAGGQAHWRDLLASAETKRAFKESIRTCINSSVLRVAKNKSTKALNEYLRTELRQLFRKVFKPVIDPLAKAKKCSREQARIAVYERLPEYIEQAPAFILERIMRVVQQGLQLALPDGDTDLKNSNRPIAKHVLSFWKQMLSFKGHGMRKVFDDCVATVSDLARLSSSVLHSDGAGKRFEAHVLFVNLTRALDFDFLQAEMSTENIGKMMEDFCAKAETSGPKALHKTVCGAPAESQASLFESLARAIMHKDATPDNNKTFIDTLYRLKHIIFFQYAHNPGLFSEEFGVPLVDFLREAGYGEASNAKGTRTWQSAFKPKLHVPLLQALCDLYDRAIRVTVLGNHTMTGNSEYLLMPRLPATTQNNSIMVLKLAFDRDSGAWKLG